MAHKNVRRIAEDCEKRYEVSGRVLSEDKKGEKPPPGPDMSLSPGHWATPKNYNLTNQVLPTGLLSLLSNTLTRYVPGSRSLTPACQ